jgi:hypothetical protein
MTSEKLNHEPTLFKPNTVVRWQQLPSRGRSGRRFLGENPPSGAHVYFSLPQNAEKVTVEFQDIEGKKLAELPAPSGAGLNMITWNTAIRPQGGMGGGGGGGGGGGQGGGRFGGGFGGRQVPPGAYRVVLNVDGKSLIQSFTIEGDAAAGRSLTGEDEDDDDR